MAIVLHLLPLFEWTELSPDQDVCNASLDTDGFIHCTDDPGVMLQVANAFYAQHAGDFIVLHVDTSRLTHRCIWEAPAHISGAGPAFADTFPHVYGRIDRAAVVSAEPVMRDEAGAFVGYGVSPAND